MDLTDRSQIERVLSEENFKKCEAWLREYPEGVDEVYYYHDGTGFVISTQYRDRRVVIVYDEETRVLKDIAEVPLKNNREGKK